MTLRRGNSGSGYLLRPGRLLRESMASPGRFTTDLLLIDGRGLVPQHQHRQRYFTRSRCSNSNLESLWNVPDDLSALAWQASLESVDDCLMGIITARHLGVSPSRQPFPRGMWSCGRYPPLGGLILHSVMVLRRWISVWWTGLWGTQWRQLDGG